MAATYTHGSGAALDRVRLLIPDKDLTGLTAVLGVYTLTTYQYTDAEIADFLTLEADPYLAAALALESLVAAGPQGGGKVSGFGFSVDDTAGYDALLKRAVWLRGQASGSSVISFVDATYDAAATTDEYAAPPSYPFDEA